MDTIHRFSLSTHVFLYNQKIKKTITCIKNCKGRLTCTGVHCAAITYYEAVPLASPSQFKERILNLYHSFQQVLLKLHSWNKTKIFFTDYTSVSYKQFKTINFKKPANNSHVA